MNKKGQRTLETALWIIAEIAIIAFLITVSFNRINTLDQQDTYERIFLSTDIGLTLTSLLSIPGNVRTTYGSNLLETYPVSLRWGLTTVHHPRASDVTAPFARDLNLPFVTREELVAPRAEPVMISVEKTSQLSLTKTDDMLIIGEPTEDRTLRYYHCPPTAAEATIVAQAPADDPVAQGFQFSYPEGKISAKKPGKETTYLRFEQKQGISEVYALPKDHGLACAVANALIAAGHPAVIVPIDQDNTYHSILTAYDGGVVILLDTGSYTISAGRAIGAGVARWHS